MTGRAEPSVSWKQPLCFEKEQLDTEADTDRNPKLHKQYKFVHRHHKIENVLNCKSPQFWRLLKGIHSEATDVGLNLVDTMERFARSKVECCTAKNSLACWCAGDVKQQIDDGKRNRQSLLQV